MGRNLWNWIDRVYYYFFRSKAVRPTPTSTSGAARTTVQTGTSPRSSRASRLARIGSPSKEVLMTGAVRYFRDQL